MNYDAWREQNMKHATQRIRRRVIWELILYMTFESILFGALFDYSYTHRITVLVCGMASFGIATVVVLHVLKTVKEYF